MRKDTAQHSKELCFESWFLTKCLGIGSHNPTCNCSLLQWHAATFLNGRSPNCYDMMIFPINRGSLHWLQVSFDMQSHMVEPLDSMDSGFNDHRMQFSLAIWRWLHDCFVYECPQDCNDVFDDMEENYGWSFCKARKRLAALRTTVMTVVFSC